MRLAHGGEGRFVFAVPDSRFPNPYSRFPIITLVAYDSTWPLEFAAEAERIERACAGLPIRLEHIGSTAVPGLAAKPVIDILAGRPGNMSGDAYVAAFRQLGYEHKGAYGIPGRNYFRRGSPRTHHVHLVSWSSEFWRAHILFRDYLRAHPGVAREYETIKRELAGMSLQDKENYTDAKGPFIRSIVRRARGQDDEGEV
ncbi:MAG: hypothetical protein K0S86_397 [Geminicoccaceae bacterium]|nr:hypothetical protein [Geminicoccaceae bacterium]